jgi:type 1 glutamine amidotransferase
VTAALLLTGGPDHAHDFPSSSRALAGVLRDAGFEVTVVDHPDQLVGHLLPGAVDLLVVNALRWRMLPDRYAPWRDEWAYRTAPATSEAITSFVAGGGGLLASHTASICFDDWPEWGDVLGGSWQWDVSSHPPVGPVEAHTASERAARHPVLRGLPSTLALDDEVYGDLALRPGVDVLMTARRTPDDAEQPVVWAYRYGEGRVVYDGFGHDAASIRHPQHAALLRQAAAWVTEEDT